MNLNADTASKNEPEKNKKSAYKLSPHGSNPDLDSVDVNTIPQTDYSDEAFTKSPQAKKSETDDQVKDRINLPPGYTPSTEEEYMNPYQLEYFRQILLAEYDNLHDAFQGVDIDTFDENTPDGKTIARGRKLLYKIENILKTIDDETYGYCVDTGEEIGLQRLLERPMAERTTEAQERFDDAKKKMNLSANKASKSEPEKIKNSASKLSPHGFNPDVESVDLNTLPQTDYSDEAFSKSREANKSETIARADRNKPEKISKTTKPSIDYSIYENTKNITSKKLKQNDKTNNADEIFAKAVHYLKQKDQKQALRHMKDAAKKGSEEAMYELGLSYTHGLFSDIDYKIALGYYQEAANLKNSKAMHNLAIAYSLGRGVNVNYDVAFQWFEKAATYFNIDSINALGVCYESGQGVDIDLEKAAGYFETAMNNGHVLAARNLANYYYRGKHFEVDRNKAADIWESLAKAGDILSAKDIGICYENGQGRDKNLKQARAWYKIAADGGNEDAIKYLKELK
jgi:TPR repeat protein/RNA polymerase-binding transcription factor DksA